MTGPASDGSAASETGIGSHFAAPPDEALDTFERGIEAVQIGQGASFSRTVTEGDVSLFAGLSGDLHPLHVDAEFAKGTRFGQRVAHGALLVAYMSAASTRYVQTYLDGHTTQMTVWYGFDRIRFIKPVFLGDTIRITYQIEEIDVPAEKAFALVKVTNQREETVAAARHILKFV